MCILQNGAKNRLCRCYLRVSATSEKHRHRLRSFLLLIKASCSVVLRALYESVILSRSLNAAALDSCLFDLFVGQDHFPFGFSVVPNRCSFPSYGMHCSQRAPPTILCNFVDSR